MPLLLMTTFYAGYVLTDMFFETIASTSANAYYDNFSAFFWGAPAMSAEELALRAATGSEIEYLNKICSSPFLSKRQRCCRDFSPKLNGRRLSWPWCSLLRSRRSQCAQILSPYKYVSHGQ